MFKTTYGRLARKFMTDTKSHNQRWIQGSSSPQIMTLSEAIYGGVEQVLASESILSSGVEVLDDRAQQRRYAFGQCVSWTIIVADGAIAVVNWRLWGLSTLAIRS